MCALKASSIKNHLDGTLKMRIPQIIPKEIKTRRCYSETWTPRVAQKI